MRRAQAYGSRGKVVILDAALNVHQVLGVRGAQGDGGTEDLVAGVAWGGQSGILAACAGPEVVVFAPQSRSMGSQRTYTFTETVRAVPPTCRSTRAVAVPL